MHTKNCLATEMADPGLLLASFRSLRPWNYHCGHCHGDVLQVTSHTSRKTVSKGSNGNHTEGDALFRVDLFRVAAERAGLILNDGPPLKHNGFAAKDKRLLHRFLSHCIGVC